MANTKCINLLMKIHTNTHPNHCGAYFTQVTFFCVCVCWYVCTVCVYLCDFVCRKKRTNYKLPNKQPDKCVCVCAVVNARVRHAASVINAFAPTWPVTPREQAIHKHTTAPSMCSISSHVNNGEYTLLHKHLYVSLYVFYTTLNLRKYRALMLATYLAFVARHSHGICGCLCLLTDINGRAFLRVTGVCVSIRVRVPGMDKRLSCWIRDTE